jgi:anthranilate/para-aminobenzoate synthase component II
MKKVLVLNVCKEKLHYYEFVKPIVDVLKINNVGFFVKDLDKISKKDLENTSKIIICGTSLKDNSFLSDIKKFEWIINCEKPILGICAGMQIIGVLNGGKIKNKTEIGFYSEMFEKEFLGLKDKQEVYHLHNNFIDFKKLKDFEIVCENENVVQAVKHKEKEIYGVLFHPEVRQKEMILNFVLI